MTRLKRVAARRPGSNPGGRTNPKFTCWAAYTKTDYEIYAMDECMPPHTVIEKFPIPLFENKQMFGGFPWATVYNDIYNKFVETHRQ